MIRRKTNSLITDTCWNNIVKMMSASYDSSVCYSVDFLEVGNVDVFLESCTIASACNKVFRKRFLKPETICLIPSGGYSCNRNYSKKAIMWILHMEEEDTCKILHARNGREVRLPELPNFSVDGYCAETRTILNLWGVSSRGV